MKKAEIIGRLLGDMEKREPHTLEFLRKEIGTISDLIYTPYNTFKIARPEFFEKGKKWATTIEDHFKKIALFFSGGNMADAEAKLKFFWKSFAVLKLPDTPVYELNQKLVWITPNEHKQAVFIYCAFLAWAAFKALYSIPAKVFMHFVGEEFARRRAFKKANARVGTVGVQEFVPVQAKQISPATVTDQDRLDAAKKHYHDKKSFGEENWEKDGISYGDGNPIYYHSLRASA